MQVIINELVSKVRAIDGQSVLSPSTLQRIVETVLEAVQQDEDHTQRTSEERSLNNYQQHKSTKK